jgi:hypothetical protein
MDLEEKKDESGSIELIVLGLLAALIVVLAIPLLSSIGSKTNTSLNKIDSEIPTPTS